MTKFELQYAGALVEILRQFTEDGPGFDRWDNLLSRTREQIANPDGEKHYPTTHLGQLLILQLQGTLGIEWFNPHRVSQAEILELLRETSKFLGLVKEKMSPD